MQTFEVSPTDDVDQLEKRVSIATGALDKVMSEAIRYQIEQQLEGSRNTSFAEKPKITFGLLDQSNSKIRASEANDDNEAEKQEDNSNATPVISTAIVAEQAVQEEVKKEETKADKPLTIIEESRENSAATTILSQLIN